MSVRERSRCREVVLSSGWIPHPHDPTKILESSGLLCQTIMTAGIQKQFHKMRREGAFPPHPPLGPVQRCFEHSQCPKTCVHRPIVWEGGTLSPEACERYIRIFHWAPPNSSHVTSCRHSSLFSDQGMYHCPECGVMLLGGFKHPTDEACRFQLPEWTPPVYDSEHVE